MPNDPGLVAAWTTPAAHTARPIWTGSGRLAHVRRAAHARRRCRNAPGSSSARPSARNTWTHRRSQTVAEAPGCARASRCCGSDYPGTGDRLERSDTAVAQFQVGVRAAVDYLARAAGAMVVGCASRRNCLPRAWLTDSVRSRYDGAVGTRSPTGAAIRARAAPCIDDGRPARRSRRRGRC